MCRVVGEQGRVLERVKGALTERVRLHVDDREQYTPGWKYNEYELRGVPLRLEVGPKDVAKGTVMSVRRDNRAKESIPLESLAPRVTTLLDEVQAALLESARAFRAENTAFASTLEEIEAHFGERRGFVAAPWDGSPEFEAQVRERTGATMRCVPLDQAPYAGRFRAAHPVALFARAY